MCSQKECPTKFETRWLQEIPFSKELTYNYCALGLLFESKICNNKCGHHVHEIWQVWQYSICGETRGGGSAMYFWLILIIFGGQYKNLEEGLRSTRVGCVNPSPSTPPTNRALDTTKTRTRNRHERVLILSGHSDGVETVTELNFVWAHSLYQENHGEAKKS